MSKLLRTLFGVIVLSVLFVLGWGFGEKNTTSTWSLWFVAQSVKSDTEKAVRKDLWKLSLLMFPEDKTIESIWSDPATKEVKCPGADGDIYFAVPSHTDIKMYDKEGSELNTYGFQLSMIAQNNQVPGTLVKAILHKNPFDFDKCVYKTKDDKLVILSIKLTPGFDKLTEDGKWFKKSEN